MATINNNIGFSMLAGVEHVGTKSIAPSGFNQEYGYWRGNKHRTVIENKFNQLYMAFEGSGVTGGATYPLTWNNAGETVPIFTTAGAAYNSSVNKAGSLSATMGNNAIQERSVFLGKHPFMIASGITTEPYFSAYAKVLPSGNMADTVIMGQHNADPAQFILGCDGDGKFYVRSDGVVSGVNIPYYAKSSKNFADYDYPVHIVGTYASGDGFLKLYVNGDLESQSASFTRDITDNSDTHVYIGKRQFAFDQRPFTGWYDELGVGNVSMKQSDVKDLYYSTFGLSRFIRDEIREDGDAGSGTISKCGCTTLPTSVQAEITGITLPEGGTDKGAVGEKITLTYDAAATYTDSAGPTTYTGIWDSGTASLSCGGTVRLRLYCGASSNFYMAHDFSFMSVGEEQSGSQVCSPLNIAFALAGVTSGGGGCCSDDAAAEIAVTVTGSPTPQSFSGAGFGAGFLATDETYIHFVVESGVLSSDRGKSLRSQSMGKTVGGAYDKTLWGTVAEHAISSQITFDLEPSYGNFHQLTDISVEVLAEHLTNHPSGAKLSVSIDKKSAGPNELNWYPLGVMVPSGSLQKLTFTKDLDETVYRLDSRSFKEEFDDHQLRLTVYYPQSDEPYDGEFKIYSTRVNYGSFSRIDTAVSTEPTLFTKGGSLVSASGNMPLFVNADIAAGSLELFMDATLPQLLGGSVMSADASVITNKDISLFTQGGMITLETPMYILGSTEGKTGFVEAFGSIGLETKGGRHVFPHAQATTSLFIKDVVSGSGLVSDSMNLFLKPAPSILTSGTMNMSVRGDFNKTIPLFLKGAEASTATATLMLEGAEQYSTSGTMNLVIKQADPLFLGTSQLSSNAGVVTNNNTSLHISGLGFPSGTIPLSMPNTIGKPNNSTTLNIEGYE